ncbi:MAG: serine/threonine protein kinase [Planctomycetes bacterium]|nr:serine/threonine protein kinase [Planctomycetota bacterium]
MNDADDATRDAASPTPSRSPLSDAALDQLRAVLDEPDLGATRYELREPLGRGGMGTVWRAFDRELQRDVALKVLDEPVPERAAAMAEQLLAEARVLARLEHPGIVPVHDVGTLPDGRVYVAMKQVRGERLDRAMTSGLEEAQRHRLFARIAETVAFAHSRGVLHRDLKPQNLMVGEFGEVLVLDWGLAVALRGEAALREVAPAKAEAAEGEARAGTPGWMAPEQAAGGPIDERADVHALGRLVDALWPDGRERPLRAIVAKATAAAPAARYATVAELAADVERWRAGAAVSALPEAWPQRFARHYRRYRAAYWLIGTYVVLRIAFELWRARVAGAA